jgi:hypothetical protein
MNDLQYIFYDAKLMFLDTVDMTSSAERAHRRLCDFIWFQGNPPYNDDATLCQITHTNETEWPAVKRELAKKGWQDAGEFMVHKAVIATLNDSRQRYVSNFNRQCSMTGVIVVGRPVPSGSSKGEIELPPRFPATAQDAIRTSQSVGCSEEFAIRTWNQAMSRCGRDARDIAIRSWPHHLAAAWKYEQNRKAENASHIRNSTDRSSGTYNANTSTDGIKRKIR